MALAAVAVVAIELMKTYLRKISAAAGLWLAAATMLNAAPVSPFTLTAEVQPRTGGELVRFSFNVPPDHVLYPDRLQVQTVDGQALVPVVAPQTVMHHDEVSGKDKLVYDHPFSMDFNLTNPLPANLVVKFQGCSNAACYFPESHSFALTPNSIVAVVEPPPADDDGSNTVASAVAPGAPATASLDGLQVAARGTGFMAKGEFVSFLQAARTGHAATGGLLARLGGLGLAATICLIVLGGLGLNLTPCVLPMIPINLAIIGAGSRSGSRGRGFALGAAYGGGMTVVYGVLGLFVVLTGSKFGTLNSSPWFNFGIAIVFVVLGLSMFDIGSIDLSRFQGNSTSSGRSQKSQFVLAFTIGAVAALLAGACVAPVVISVLLLATQLYGKGVLAGLLLPFLLGLGMALPWPFAGAGLSFLPKPGKWMKYIKFSFGALILLFAAYYGYLGGGLLMTQHRLVVNARSRPGDGPVATASDTELNAALQQARTEGKPVFIDFRATWCKNCEAMDAAVFPAAEVKRQLADFVVVKYDAEKPNESPAREVLDRFGVMGLPTYVVVLPRK